MITINIRSNRKASTVHLIWINMAISMALNMARSRRGYNFHGCECCTAASHVYKREHQNEDHGLEWSERMLVPQFCMEATSETYIYKALSGAVS